MVRGWRSVLLVVLLSVPLSVAACASWYEQPSGIRYERYRISEEEIELEQGKVNNMYVLIARLRPHWLEGEVVVYEGQSLLGSAGFLGNLAPDYAEWLEFLDRSQAVAQLPGLGSRRIDGAILIHR